MPQKLSFNRYLQFISIFCFPLATLDASPCLCCADKIKIDIAALSAQRISQFSEKGLDSVRPDEHSLFVALTLTHPHLRDTNLGAASPPVW